MQDFLKSIDNKEILIEVLHHSIDYLIENRDDYQTIRMCHKYGFQNPDDLVLTTRTIASYYRNCCVEGLGGVEPDLNTEFAGLSAELRRLVPAVLSARRPEIIRYLTRCRNAQDYTALESFDWDTRIILGDSSYTHNNRQLTTLTINCRQPNWKRQTLHMQMSKPQLIEFIACLDLALNERAQANE